MKFGEYILRKLLKNSAFLLFLFATSATWAGQYRVSSGTGFFVSNSGHIVTAAHVVNGCNEVIIRGATKPSKAMVIGRDEEKDIAILKTNASPLGVASLMNNNGYMDRGALQVGDFVMVIGYPLERGKNGIYKVEKAKITGLKGPQNEPEWIQFSDSAQFGNSGGPLLDVSGNVTGVIVGKAKVVRTSYGERDEIISQSDIAVTLPVLKEILRRYGVDFNYSQSHAYYSPKEIERKARRYIVNIHCIGEVKKHYNSML